MIANDIQPLRPQNHTNLALGLGASPEKIAHLNWGSFVANNLLPVTLGNIVGGVVFVGCSYWFVYLKKSKAKGNV